MYIQRRRLSKAKVIIIAFVSLFAMVYVTMADSDDYIQTNTKFFKVEQIVIDAGHGGIDAGAVAVNDELEKNINLSIALKLKDLLEVSGYEVIMTRTEDVSIHDEKYTTVHKQKSSDLINRLKIANKNPNSITVSIHQNFFQQSSSNGAQMFYSKNNSLSKYLASSLQEAFKDTIQPENTREITQATKSVYLINNSTTPTVLAECGFLSNPQEAELLIQEDYQSKVAFVLYCGIVDFVEKVNNGDSFEEDIQ